MFSESMAANNSPYCLLSVLISSLIAAFLLNIKISMASNSLSVDQSLSGNQTLISKDGTFALGYFTPAKSRNFYIGIWYNNLPVQTVVWVANREAPITDTTLSKLRISDHGELVLLNSSGSLIWSSTSTAKATAAILLDTGNLVLRNDSNSEINLWQSFAHPTDTWMPGGWLGVNQITGEYQSLTSWKSADDPAPGLFAQSMNPDGSDEYVLIWNGTTIYWGSGRWNGQYFANVPGTRENTVFNFSYFHTKQRKFATYTINVKSIITRYVVDSEGQGRQWYWLSSTQQWQTEFTQPLAHCDVYSLCGPFGVCDDTSSDSICRCVEGFEPASDQEWENSDWSSGCLRKTQLRCEEDGFNDMPNMNLPSNSANLNNISTEVKCRETCLKNCSCTAYVYDINNGCSVWKEKIRNLRQVSDGGGTLFIRLSASDLRSSNNNVVLPVALGVVAGIAGLFVIAFSLICIYRRRKKALSARKVEGSSLVHFSYTGLRRITKNFSEKIGSGGFGSVFKGTLLNSTPVAVKRLEGAMQGEKQFRAEVSTLGAIQHINLVRLHGFCSEGDKKLLVYEFMPRSSLSSLLFRHGSTELDWKLRFRIILGAARGLAYLHEECRERIIHCDVKPDNVLLDAEYNARVSDFGMAKLIGRDFSRVLTTMRGTVGYLAPEWISGSPITPKVDVYSYGMMLFEVVSGKRNAVRGDERRVFYPSWAAGKVVEGDVESLLDERLEGAADLGQLTRVCRVACWCVQDVEDLRPGMGQVVQILEGGLEVSVPPLPDSLRNMFSSRSDFLWSFNEDEREEKDQE